ncbi:MAG TPA: HNH endonuclease signature motif containing protein [Anaeromyxobacteraceae bacterium]|nr:HNH endonuclease signature motif containing protein [Anaeromyxobacteraceae bacterium]
MVDHVQALKRGGAYAPSNMQWQTVQDAKAKDRME